MHFGKKLKIDKGILVPEVTTHKGVSEREAFLLSMEIGDSFKVEPHPEDPSNNVSQNYTATGKRLGMKMTSRKIYSEDDPKSYHFRIWYIEKIEPKTATQQRNSKRNTKVSAEQTLLLKTTNLKMQRLDKTPLTTWLQVDYLVIFCFWLNKTKKIKPLLKILED